MSRWAARQIPGRPPTSSSCIGRSQWCQRFLQIIDAVYFLLGILKVEANCSAGGRYVLERGGSREIQSPTQFLDKGIGIKRIEQVDIPWRTTENLTRPSVSNQGARDTFFTFERELSRLHICLCRLLVRISTIS